MAHFGTFTSGRGPLALGAVLLVALGAAGGAGAEALTRPGIEMAPAHPVTIASLPQRQGVVTVKGVVAEIYGDRFVVADSSGRTMIDAGPRADAVRVGAGVTVQGRYDNGQLHASYLIDPSGTVQAVGPVHGPHGPHGPGRDGPGQDAPPPPGGPARAGCGPAGEPGAPPPPPAAAPAAQPR